MNTAASIEIDRPIAEVFDCTINRVAEWSSVVVEDEVIESKPDRVGTTFRMVTEQNGQRIGFLGVVTWHEPPYASSAFLTGQQFDLEVEYKFEDLGGRTRVTQMSTVTGKGVIKLMFFFFGWMMNKSSRNAAENELTNLKRLLENGAVDS
jgi:hypothetical protein